MSPSERMRRNNSSASEIDAIDLRILAALQENGRITNIDLAEITGISAPPCLRRKQNLEKRGYIRGYYAALDGPKLGYEISAFVFVGLVSQSDDNIRAFEESVRGWPMVREAYGLSGSVDFLLRCVAPNLVAFQQFVTETVMKSPRVFSVKTALSMNVSKYQVGIPLP